MDKDENKIRVSEADCLTQQVMLDYINDKLSPTDRNRVEKHLLECDFCSYAIEGLSMTANNDALDSLEELVSKRVSAESLQQKRKVLSMRFKYGIAAALALLAISGGILYFTLSNAGKDEKIVSQNIKPNNSTDITHAATKQESEETKTLTPSSSQVEEKKIVVSTVPAVRHHHATHADESPSLPKPDNKEIMAATKNQKVDSARQSTVPGGATVIGYKTPLVDRSNVITQTTVDQQEIVNAPKRDINSLAPSPAASPPTAIYEKEERGALNARNSGSNASAYYAKSKRQVSTESGHSSKSQKDSSFSVAMNAYNKKQYSTATQLFDDYLKQNPNDEKAAFYDAVSNLNIDSAATSLTELDKVLTNEKSSFYDDANWYKALALTKLHRNKEARALLRKIKKSNSKHSHDAADMLDGL